jgi:hypothetical protein
VLIALSPILAPFALLGLGIWWMARKRSRPRRPSGPIEAAPAPRARRVQRGA